MLERIKKFIWTLDDEREEARLQEEEEDKRRMSRRKFFFMTGGAALSVSAAASIVDELRGAHPTIPPSWLAPGMSLEWSPVPSSPIVARYIISDIDYKNGIVTFTSDADLKTGDLLAVNEARSKRGKYKPRHNSHR